MKNRIIDQVESLRDSRLPAGRNRCRTWLRGECNAIADATEEVCADYEKQLGAQLKEIEKLEQEVERLRGAAEPMVGHSEAHSEDAPLDPQLED